MATVTAQERWAAPGPLLNRYILSIHPPSSAQCSPGNITASYTLLLQATSLLSPIPSSQDSVSGGETSITFFSSFPQQLILQPLIFLGKLLPSPIPTIFTQYTKCFDVYPGKSHRCSPVQASRPLLSRPGIPHPSQEVGQHSSRCP